MTRKKEEIHQRVQGICRQIDYGTSGLDEHLEEVDYADQGLEIGFKPIQYYV